MWRSTFLAITPEMLNLIAAIDEFKGAWRALGTIAPKRLQASRRVQADQERDRRIWREWHRAWDRAPDSVPV